MPGSTFVSETGKANAQPQSGPSRVFPGMPHLNAITFGDIGGALAQGIADFRQAPLFGLFFGGFFALGGLFIVASFVFFDMSWMIYPFAIGFPLIGPFAAVGLYEVSRRIEHGRPLVWREILGVIWRQRAREFSWMAFVTLFIFWIWIYQVRLLIAVILGFKASSNMDRFINVLATTNEGMLFLIVGHVVGAVLALVLYSVTVVSLPFLLERNTDFITAIATSVKAVFISPIPMLGWGVCVTILIIAGSLPAFLGFFVVLPILGHATWHLYRKIVPPLPGEH
jgi:uncharacterized membrane protein